MPGFGVVGVNAGHAFSLNKCLDRELSLGDHRRQPGACLLREHPEPRSRLHHLVADRAVEPPNLPRRQLRLVRLRLWLERGAGLLRHGRHGRGRHRVADRHGGRACRLVVARRRDRQRLGGEGRLLRTDRRRLRGRPRLDRGHARLSPERRRRLGRHLLDAHAVACDHPRVGDVARDGAGLDAGLRNPRRRRGRLRRGVVHGRASRHDPVPLERVRRRLPMRPIEHAGHHLGADQRVGDLHRSTRHHQQRRRGDLRPNDRHARPPRQLERDGDDERRARHRHLLGVGHDE